MRLAKGLDFLAKFLTLGSVNAQLQHHYLQTNGIKLHVVEAGASSGPLVILLHGFPEFWYGWRYQIEALAAAGFRVLAPDQRGYNLSDKPKSVHDYNLDQLAADVVGLIDAVGREKAFLVGHDWGGASAWWAAIKHPERIEKLAILNSPHPRVMRKNIFHNPVQRKKSWYFFLFQIPFLPERRMRKNNWQIGARALQRTSRQGTFTETDMALYRKAWSQPGATTGMLNWYRAAFRSRPGRVRSSRVTMPTLILWGAKDKFLQREMAEQSIGMCDDGKLVFIENASHWVQHEEAGRVNQYLYEFFRSV